MTICYPVLDLLMDFGAGLVSVADVFITREPITASWGNTACDPLSVRVANPGNLNFLLNNSQYNSATKLGYYSPGNTNKRAGFGLETPVVLKIGYGGVFKYKRYYISSIRPVPGIYGDRQTEIVATDFMGRLLYQNVQDLAIQVSKRVDEGLATLISLLPTAPLATAYSVAPEVQDFLFTDIIDETPFMTVVQHLALTDAGYIFSKGDTSGGETFCYENRHERQLRSSSLSLNNTMKGISVELNESQLFNDITVTAYPPVISTVDEILYSYPKEFQIGAGKYTTFRGVYCDPGSGSTGTNAQVWLQPGTGVSPVADVDFKASKVAGSLSGDANGYLNFTVYWYANYAEVWVTNTSPDFDIFVMPFMLRGRIMRLYNPVETRVKDTALNYQKYGRRVLSYPMYYQSNINFAVDMANHWFNMWHNPSTNLPQYVEFTANWDTTLMAAAVSMDIGSRFYTFETVTGISNQLSVIGVELTITDGAMLTVRYYVEPWTLIGACILDDATWGELDSFLCMVGF